jgi:hypothetical protein
MIGLFRSASATSSSSWLTLMICRHCSPDNHALMLQCTRTERVGPHISGAPGARLSLTLPADLQVHPGRMLMLEATWPDCRPEAPSPHAVE